MYYTANPISRSQPDSMPQAIQFGRNRRIALALAGTVLALGCSTDSTNNGTTFDAEHCKDVYVNTALTAQQNGVPISGIICPSDGTSGGYKQRPVVIPPPSDFSEAELKAFLGESRYAQLQANARPGRQTFDPKYCREFYIGAVRDSVNNNVPVKEIVCPSDNTGGGVKERPILIPMPENLTSTQLKEYLKELFPKVENDPAFRTKDKQEMS